MAGDHDDWYHFMQHYGDRRSDEPPSAKPTVDERLSRIEEQLRVIVGALKAMPPRQSVPDVTPYVPKPSEPIKQMIGDCHCARKPCPTHDVRIRWTAIGGRVLVV